MAGDIAFTIFGGILLVIGFAGTIVPVLPGAPLAWIGLLLAYFSPFDQIFYSSSLLITIANIPVSRDKPIINAVKKVSSVIYRILLYVPYVRLLLWSSCEKDDLKQ